MANKVVIFSCVIVSILAIYNVTLLVAIVTSFVHLIIARNTFFVGVIFLLSIHEDSVANLDIVFVMYIALVYKRFLLLDCPTIQGFLQEIVRDKSCIGIDISPLLGPIGVSASIANRIT